jgi:NADH:ubiquinone oxidoreductase subunit 2 (subunit N)
MIYLLPEIFVLATVIVSGVSLLLRSIYAQRFREIILLFGMSAAAISAIFVNKNIDTIQIGLLQLDSLYRFPRAILFLSTCVISRIVIGTKEIPNGRKPETLFLLASMTLLCDILLLSRNLALSYVLLFILSWLGAFLVGLAFRGANEGEALLKHWFQNSIGLILGAGALVIISSMAGGVDYSHIAIYLSNLAEYSPTRLFVIFILYLPFFLVAGLFPFHLAQIDRDDGAPWAIQSVLSILACGSVILALWGMAAKFFTTDASSMVPDGLRFLQLCGLVGGAWLAFFALGQKNSKRLFSSLMGGAWSVLLVSGSLHSPMAAAAIVYGVCSIFLWGSLLSFVWSRLQEGSGEELVSAIFGAGRVNRGYGLLLIFALASPMLFPAFPGFTGVIIQLASVIEQKNLLMLVLFSLLLIFSIILSSRLAADVLFRRVSEERRTSFQNDFVRHDVVDVFPISIVILVLLCFGIMGNSVFGSLYESAKVFLN